MKILDMQLRIIFRENNRSIKDISNNSNFSVYNSIEGKLKYNYDFYITKMYKCVYLYSFHIN